MTDVSGAVFTAVDEPALAAIASSLAAPLGTGGVVHLHGSLGAGKTTFARALLRAMGVGERIKSPTYTLIETYTLADLSVHHLDLYRIAAADELEWLGLRDLASGPQLWLIEWPERVGDAIPAPDLIVDLTHAGAFRDMHLRPITSAARQWLSTAALPNRA